jgi:predicted chitinase
LAISDVAEKAWNEQYGDKLVGLTTTSLYSSYSQYQNLSYWTKRGHSSGSIKFEPTKETLEIVKQYLKKTWPRKYWEWYLATEPQGMPLKRDFKQRSLAFLYSQLDIEKSYFETNHQRGIYFCPLYTNTCEYLRQEITEDKLVKRFDNSVESLVKIWKEKYATKRLKSLIDGKRLNPDTLFYGDVVTMTWEQTKVKYLKEVGR